MIIEPSLQKLLSGKLFHRIAIVIVGRLIAVLMADHIGIKHRLLSRIQLIIIRKIKQYAVRKHHIRRLLKCINIIFIKIGDL